MPHQSCGHNRCVVSIAIAMLSLAMVPSTTIAQMQAQADIILPGGRSSAATFTVGDLTITSPQVWAMPAGDKVAAGYLKITNNGIPPDRFLSAATGMAERVEIREVSIKDGVVKVRVAARRTRNQARRDCRTAIRRLSFVVQGP